MLLYNHLYIYFNEMPQKRPEDNFLLLILCYKKG